MASVCGVQGDWPAASMDRDPFRALQLTKMIPDARGAAMYVFQFAYYFFISCYLPGDQPVTSHGSVAVSCDCGRLG